LKFHGLNIFEFFKSFFHFFPINKPPNFYWTKCPTLKKQNKSVQNFLNLSINQSHHHATLEIKTKLLNSGFKQLSEKERKILTLTFSLET
jgi:hypothetical protein